MQDFLKATWRGLTGPKHGEGDSVVSFCAADGSIIRLTLAPEDARALRDALVERLDPILAVTFRAPAGQPNTQASDYSALRAAFHAQEDNSSGNPACDVSKPLEGE